MAGECPALEKECPDGYNKAELRTIAKACGIRLTRARPMTGYKTKQELCTDIAAAAPAASAAPPAPAPAPDAGPSIAAVPAITNETFGQTVEYMIASQANVPCTIARKRIDSNLVEDAKLRETIRTVVASLPRIESHIGNQNKDIDFLLENEESLSVKTNDGTNMVCPQNIGQPSRQKFLALFGHLLSYRMPLDSQDPIVKIKTIILNHPGHLINRYVQETFKCTYLVWIVRKKNGYKSTTLKTDRVRNTILPDRNFTFTRPTVAEWNESNSVSYNGIPIGSFQIHNKRNTVKFRFNFDNLLDVLVQSKYAVEVKKPRIGTRFFSADRARTRTQKKVPSNG